MKIIVLSDFVGSTMRDAEIRARVEYHGRLAVYRAVSERVAEFNAAQRSAAIRACGDQKFWSRFRTPERSAAFREMPPPLPPGPFCLPEQMSALATGKDGERRVRDQLGKVLGDDWTALAGYMNARGEIDLILVCPAGLVTIEIKTIKGDIYIDADDWWRDKYDHFENLVASNAPIVDKAGRSPSRQLNQPTEMLRAQLSRSGIQVNVATAVVLAHEDSTIARVLRPTVDLICQPPSLTAGAIRSALQKERPCRLDVQHVVSAICGFHRQQVPGVLTRRLPAKD